MTYRAMLLASASRRVFSWVHSLPAEMWACGERSVVSSRPAE